MNSTASMIISALIIGFAFIFMGAKFTKNELKIKNAKTIFYYIMLTISLFLGYIIDNSLVRFIINFLVLAYIYSKLYGNSLFKCLITTVITFIYAFIIDTFFSTIIFFILQNDLIIIKDINNIILITNILSAVLMILLSNVSKLNKINYKLIMSANIKNYKTFFVFVLLSILVLSFLLYYVFFEADLICSFISCIFLIGFFIIITLSLYNEKIQNFKLKTEYDILLDNLTDYEKLYNLQRIKNHENKNDLLIIRGMISENNKKALEYIDNIVKFDSHKKQNWMELLKKIPEGGLRGILYYKLLEMEKENININFLASTQYSIKSYSKLPEEIKFKICKLLGIYIDNAIQAVTDLEEKNIYINIDENNEKIIFKIANNFLGGFDLDKINEIGYTTKGKGHGYGLAIAKEIIEKEEKITNKTSIINDKFIQEIQIRKEK